MTIKYDAGELFAAIDRLQQITDTAQSIASGNYHKQLSKKQTISNLEVLLSIIADTAEQIGDMAESVLGEADD